MDALRIVGSLLVVLSTVVLLFALRDQWRSQTSPRAHILVWFLAFLGGTALYNSVLRTGSPTF